MVDEREAVELAASEPTAESLSSSRGVFSSGCACGQLRCQYRLDQGYVRATSSDFQEAAQAWAPHEALHAGIAIACEEIAPVQEAGLNLLQVTVRPMILFRRFSQPLCCVVIVV